MSAVVTRDVLTRWVIRGAHYTKPHDSNIQNLTGPCPWIGVRVMGLPPVRLTPDL